MAKRGVTCRIFRHGKSFVMSLPLQLVKALQISEGDKILIKLDEEKNLIVQKYYPTDELPPNSAVVQVRVIGGAKLSNGLFKQLGFTVPLALATKITDLEYSFPIIEEKKGDYFKIVFKVAKKMPALS